MSKKSNTRIYRKREFWEAQINEWEKSGLSQAEYCRKNNLKSKSLTYWKGRISKKPQSISFVPVSTNPSSVIRVEQIPPLRLVINNGFKVEVSENFSPTTLVRLIKTIESL